MSIKLNGATSGSIDIDVPAVVGGDFSLSLPGGGTVDRLERAGNILQVVEGSTSTEVIVSTTTYTDTGLSATITPTSTSNKILILVSQQVSSSRNLTNAGLGIRLLRDSTVIWTPIEGATGPTSSFVSAAGSGATQMKLWVHQHHQYLDSPSTTSAVTYKTQGRPYNIADSGAAIFQDASTVENGSSRIILMEVAG
jgi:hypothetical protein